MSYLKDVIEAGIKRSERYTSKSKLADAMGIHRTTLSDKLGGKKEFTRYELILMAKLLDIPREEMLK